MPVYEMPGMLIFALFSIVSMVFLAKEIIILLAFVRKFQLKPGWLRLGAAVLSIPLIIVGLVLLAKLIPEPIPLNHYVYFGLLGLIFWGLISIASWYILQLTSRQGTLLFGWMAGFGVLATVLMTVFQFLMMPEQGFLLAVN